VFGQFRHQTGLADAGLAGHEHRAATVRGRRSQGGLQTFELRRATDEPSPLRPGPAHAVILPCTATKDGVRRPLPAGR
jgi:hypothetical protein